MSDDGAELTEDEVQRLIESRAEDEATERDARMAQEDADLGAAEWYAEAALAQWDDDPSPYDGTYSEE